MLKELKLNRIKRIRKLLTEKILQIDNRTEDQKLEKVAQREILKVVKVQNRQDNLQLCRVES